MEFHRITRKEKIMLSPVEVEPRASDFQALHVTV